MHATGPYSKYSLLSLTIIYYIIGFFISVNIYLAVVRLEMSSIVAEHMGFQISWPESALRKLRLDRA